MTTEDRPPAFTAWWKTHGPTFLTGEGAEESAAEAAWAAATEHAAKMLDTLAETFRHEWGTGLTADGLKLSKDGRSQAAILASEMTAAAGRIRKGGVPK